MNYVEVETMVNSSAEVQTVRAGVVVPTLSLRVSIPVGELNFENTFPAV